MIPLPLRGALAFVVLLLAASTNAPASADGEPKAQGYQRRCGWMDNPTPQNFWLVDREGEWTISTMGEEPAEGPGLPDFGKHWVKTNGSYGYGCACMEAKVDANAKRIVSYRKVEVLPLKKCRSDPRLPKR